MTSLLTRLSKILAQKSLSWGLVGKTFLLSVTPGSLCLIPSRKEHVLSQFTFIDLFAGIGGFRIGLTSAGGVAVFTNEWDAHAATTYKAWFGESDISIDDIRTLDPKKHIPTHDVLSAGFPCQPFSIAGVSKKNSLGRAHGFSDLQQGNLFFAICDIIAIKKPKVVLLENVKNLIGHDKGKTWKVITEALDMLGYDVKHKVINAAGWVPQNRRRVFIVALKRSHFSQEVIDAFEFKSIVWVGEWGLDEFLLLPLNVFHPIKNIDEHQNLRESINDFKGSNYIPTNKLPIFIKNLMK